jgi:beta-glucosidase
MRSLLVLAALATGALATGARATGALACKGTSNDIVFGAYGSSSAPSGKDSFRFGASSAATQIEDQNTHTDW